MRFRPCFLPVVFALVLNGLQAVVPVGSFDVRAFGAVGDGRHLETSAFAAAIAACVTAGGGTVYVPPGRYLTGTIELRSFVTLHLEANAVLLGSENPDDYPPTPNVWQEGTETIAPLIYAFDAESITITGRGTIDGQGKIWWKRHELLRPNAKRGWAPPRTPEEFAEVAKVKRDRPRLIRLVRCRNVLVENVQIRNSPNWTLNPVLCDSVRVEGISIYADEGSHNTDGINPESCRDVHIANCRIDTGDDCVTLKSGTNELGRKMGRPTENVTITNCVMHRGHGGVTIGSEMSGGVRNVTVTNCVFQGTDNGIRVKSQRGRGGVVEGLVVSNIVMHDVATPFIITTFYHGTDRPEEIFPVDEGTPRYRNFHFSNITARGARIAGEITGLREMAIDDVTFDGLFIEAAAGFSCTNAQRVGFTNTVVDTAAGPALLLTNSRQVDAAGLRTRTAHADTPTIIDAGALH